MTRYIDADKLPRHGNRGGVVYWRDIEKHPTADVRENVKAHWIDMKPTGDSRFMCSRCKGKEKVPTIMGEPIVWDYCPNCGALMIGDNNV